MSFDLFGQLFGKAIRRKLEAEITKGGGPLLKAVLPLATAALQQKANDVEARVIGQVAQKAGIDIPALLGKG